MSSLNKVMIIGNLGANPENRFLPNGNPVTNMSIATSRKWKDKEGNQQEHTEWHRVVLFNRLAEIAAQYLNKGSKVYVEGSLRTNKWEKDGQTHYTTEIIASELTMLGSDQPRQNGQHDGKANAGNQESPQVTTVDNDSEFDDDIPF